MIDSVIKLPLSSDAMEKLTKSNNVKKVTQWILNNKNNFTDIGKQIIIGMIAGGTILGIKILMLKIQFIVLSRQYNSLPPIIQEDLKILTNLGIDSNTILKMKVISRPDDIIQRFKRVHNNGKARVFLDSAKVDDFLYIKFLKPSDSKAVKKTSVSKAAKKTSVSKAAKKTSDSKAVVIYKKN